MNKPEWLTFENLKIHRSWLHAQVHQSYWISLCLFTVGYMGVVVLALPFVALLTVLGGFLFGTFVGACASVIGATGGAAIFFLLVRFLLGGYVQEKYQEQLKDFNDHLDREGILYLLFLRLIIVVPFFLVNTVASLTRIPLSWYIITTAVGIFPVDLIYSFAGSRLGSLSSFCDIYSPEVISAFLFLALLALMPIIVRCIKKVVYT